MRYASFFGTVKDRARGGCELVKTESFVDGVDAAVDVIDGEGLEKLDDKFDTTPDGLEGTGASLNAEIAHLGEVDNLLYLAFDLPPAALMVLPLLAFDPTVVFVMVDQR